MRIASFAEGEQDVSDYFCLLREHEHDDVLSGAMKRLTKKSVNNLTFLFQGLPRSNTSSFIYNGVIGTKGFNLQCLSGGLSGEQKKLARALFKVVAHPFARRFFSALDRTLITGSSSLNDLGRNLTLVNTVLARSTEVWEPIRNLRVGVQGVDSPVEIEAVERVRSRIIERFPGIENFQSYLQGDPLILHVHPPFLDELRSQYGDNCECSITMKGAPVFFSTSLTTSTVELADPDVNISIHI